MEGPGSLLGYRALHKNIREVHGLNVLRIVVYNVMADVNPQGLKDRGGVGQPKRPRRKGATEYENEEPSLFDPNIKDHASSNTEVTESNTGEPQEDLEEDPLASAASVLTQFRDWLLSPDGGKKDVKTVKQHVSQLKNTLSVVDPDHKLTSPVDDKLIRTVFLSEYAAKYCATTVKSYLRSLQHYCSFLLSDQQKGLSLIEMESSGYERN